MPLLAGPSQLVENGFARYDLVAHFDLAEGDERLRRLSSSFEDLPVDPYAPGTGRYRRFARAMILPWTGEFTWIPPGSGQRGEPAHDYFQGDHNPEYVGVVRTLPAIAENVLANPLLTDIVKFDFAQTRWGPVDSRWPLHVDVHLIKLLVKTDDEEAISSPNELHQDGEPFVFTHLVQRRNAVGGGNVIATPEHRGKLPHDVPSGDLLAEFELVNQLESYGVTDHMTSHYVAPIRKGRRNAPGERSVILTDFTPMRQSLR
jgi:hypothetical protein